MYKNNFFNFYMVKPSGNPTSTSFPKDAQIIALLLKSLGVESCEPGVIPQLLEFIFRYTTDVLKEAQIFAEHAGKTDIQVDDARLAIQSKINNSFTSPPPREVSYISRN
jgi:transcription initiation factor TFIID subunit 9B